MARTITLEYTYADLATLIAANGLNTQTFYKITDRGDNGMIFQAVNTNRLANDGIRYMLCPATYATGVDAYDNDWIGVWSATKQATATEGQLCIWNGLVWVAGAALAGTSPSTEASGWTVIPKATFTNHEYIEMVFSITYDFNNDWINKQWDMFGNVLGQDKVSFESSRNPGDPNLIDYCDWNYNTSGFMLTGNTCDFIYNNNARNIQYNICKGVIMANNCLGIMSNTVRGIFLNNISQTINYNSNNGVISFNSINGMIDSNRNNGDITENSSGELSCTISSNSNNGYITGVWSSDVTDAAVNKTGT